MVPGRRGGALPARRTAAHPLLPGGVAGPGERPAHRRPGFALAVGVGGAAGTAVRYAVAAAVPVRPGGWPLATAAVNVVGALLLGLLLEGLARGGPDRGRRRVLRLLLGTGFCGGLTTFSTLAVEVDLLVRSGHGGRAVGYAVASVVAGLAAAAAGVALAAVRRR